MPATDLIDVVNESDEVIDTVQIKEAREKGLIHRIARVMVEDPTGTKLLLQKRTSDKDLWPNCWDDSAAGHVDAGEDYQTAAQRELFEELGIKADKLEKIGKYFTDTKYKGYHLRRFNYVYRFKVNKTPQNLSAREVAEVKWLRVAEVKELIAKHTEQVTDGLTDVIERYYS